MQFHSAACEDTSFRAKIVTERCKAKNQQKLLPGMTKAFVRLGGKTDSSQEITGGRWYFQFLSIYMY